MGEIPRSTAIGGWVREGEEEASRSVAARTAAAVRDCTRSRIIQRGFPANARHLDRIVERRGGEGAGEKLRCRCAHARAGSRGRRFRKRDVGKPTAEARAPSRTRRAGVSRVCLSDGPIKNVASNVT